MRAAVAPLRRLAARNHHRCQSTLVEQARALLRSVDDPLLGRDVVTTDCVSIDQRDDNLRVTLDVRTAAHPHARDIAERCRDALEHLRGVEEITISLQANGFGRSIGRPAGLASVRSAVAVASCKGGVGKSTIAALIARTLAGRGISTGLLDADIYGPSLPTLFNLHHPKVYSNQQERILPVEADGLKLMSFAFLTGDGPTVLRGPIVSQYIQQLLHAVEWGELDVLVLDLPPGTGDIQLTISQSIQIDGAVIVTTPHQLSLTDVRKGIQMFDKVNVPVLGVVENMAWFACDECSKKHYPFGSAGAKSLELVFPSMSYDASFINSRHRPGELISRAAQRCTLSTRHCTIPHRRYR